MIKKFITKEIVNGIIRHVIAAIGAMWVAKGVASHDQVTTLSDAFTDPKFQGAIVVLGMIVKSILAKHPAPVTQAAPVVQPLLAPKNQP